MSKQMTEVEALGECLGLVLKDGPSTFGKEHAEKAVNKATQLLGAGVIDAATFGRVVARLGNHSALRQWATMHGFINVEPDALHTHVEATIDRLMAAEKEELAKLGQP